MALHALSKYGEATFTGTGKPAQVTIQYSGTVFEKFQVDSNNRLLLQRTSLPKVPGEYTMTVTGEGCVYLQVRLLGHMGSEGPLEQSSLKKSLTQRGAWAAQWG